MPAPKTNEETDAPVAPPPLERGAEGHPDLTSLADLVQWFLDHDPRVAVVKHPKVEELFQWKQGESRREGEDVFMFSRAEDRLAIGIMQALATHADQATLHGWISQLLNTLDEATKINEEMAEAYKLEMDASASTVKEASKIPNSRGRTIFLTSCWLKVLCTAEIRVLGWVYRELYGRPYTPETIS